jgi:hypothetical protein
VVLRRLVGVGPSTATGPALGVWGDTFLMESTVDFRRLMGVATVGLVTASVTGFAILALVVAGMISEYKKVGGVK